VSLDVATDRPSITEHEVPVTYWIHRLDWLTNYDGAQCVQMISDFCCNTETSVCKMCTLSLDRKARVYDCHLPRSPNATARKKQETGHFQGSE